MPFLAPIGAAIAAAGSAIAATAVSAGLGVAAYGGLAAIAGNALIAVGSAAASLTGALGIASAISSWSTVALFASSFLSKPKVGIGAAGSQVNLQADPNAGIPLILGRSGTAGKVLHANTSGQVNKNAALFYLLALTAGPLGGLESLTASDFPVVLSGDGVVSPPQYAQSMYLRTTPGLKPDPQAYYPGGVDPAWMPEWTAAHKLSGVACAWWTLVYNTKAYPSGMPQPMFVVVGPPVYDPRRDSTYPGGSGPQRWNDETTWSFAGNTNPFLQGLSWAIGRRDNGKLSFGIGAPIDAIDVAAFVEGANVNEANAWTIGGEVLSSDGKWDVLTTMLQAGGGEPIKMGGLISAYVRTPRVVLGTLVGADLIDAASITGTKRRRDRLNQIIPSYRSEDHGWEMVPADPVFVNEYIAADGGLRSKEGNYPLVQDVAQVAQLATYDILDAREFEPIVLPVGPRWHAIRPGDCIALNEPEFALASGQTVVVQTREFDLLSGRVTLTCRSESLGKHDYALGKTTLPPPVPGFQPQDPAYVARPDAGTWVATGGVLSGADGAQVPAIWVTGAINDPNVSSIIVEYQLQLAPGVFGDWVSGEFPSTTRRMEFRSVISGATYHVQVRYRSVRNVEGALALDLGLVTVGTLISGGVTNIGGQTPQELIDQLNETTALGLATSEQAAQTAEDLLPVAASADYSKTRIDLIGTLLPSGSVFQMSDTTLFADATTTWGDYKTSLQAKMNGNTAAITQEQTVRANADTALATQITNLSTTVGGNTASITNLQNSVNGLNAQWVLSVSSQGSGPSGPYAHVAGIKVAANPAVSSIAFQADQIGFTNGIDPNIFPLAVVGGKVIATSFQADDIKANTITTDKIVANNIAQRTAGYAAGPTVLTTANQTIITLVVDCSGGVLDLELFGNVYGSANETVNVNILLDGDTIGGAVGCANLSFSIQNPIAGKYSLKPTKNSHTITVFAWKQGLSGGTPITLTYLNAYLTDNKTQT